MEFWGERKNAWVAETSFVALAPESARIESLDLVAKVKSDVAGVAKHLDVALQAVVAEG